MANKTISQLTEATEVQSSDLFVLEQTGSAKKLTGQTLENWLVALANGHGGIQSITKTSGSGLVDTYTVLLSDNTTYDFTVTNGADGTNGTNGTNGTDGVTFTPSVSAEGVISWTNDGERENPDPVNIKGVQGDAGHVWIKWSSIQPTSDSDIGDVPDKWMGVYTGSASTAPTTYTSYAWYEVKGEQGNPGTPITAVVRTSGDGSPGTDDTYTVYVDSTVVGTIIVHNGADGVGTVNSVNNIGVSAGTNNITLTAADVGAPTVPLHLTDNVTSLPKTISDQRITSTMMIANCTWGTPSAILSDVTYTTSDGNIVLSGTMSGSTTIDLILIETT